MREELRIAQLQEAIMHECVHSAVKEEFRPLYPFQVMDISDTKVFADLTGEHLNKRVIQTFGGVLGELIIILHAIGETMQAQGAYHRFTCEQIKEIMMHLNEKELLGQFMNLQVKRKWTHRDGASEPLSMEKQLHEVYTNLN